MRNDRLPKSGSFILNLDGKRGPGTHWTAIYKNREYYDSFGLPPPPELQHIKVYNRIQHQAPFSTLCGLFALAYIYLRNRNFSPYYINYQYFKEVSKDASKENWEKIKKITKELH